VADELSPLETVRLDHSKILGLAMDKGAYTGHLAILARSFGIPCVVSLGNVSSQIQNGSLCALDGSTGRFIIEPDQETLEGFRLKEETRQQKIVSLAKHAAEPACTKDGVHILVCANISSSEEARQAAAQGADGVGVFRTEYLYMDKNWLPFEEEQFQVYKESLEALGDKPLVIRTLDIGGDKAHPALGLEKEDNPFLGYRAIRLSLGQPDVFRAQLRAILRAAAFGKVELMLPMVGTLDEILRARQFVEECRKELAAQGIKAGSPPLGIMVETPAAALMAREFAAETDFFSIGTNDLTQYTLAVDRGNPRIATLYDPLDPAVLRLMALTCDAAIEEGIPVGICGELAANPKALPLLIGLGMTELSVSASWIPGIKAEIRSLEKEKCREFAQKALTLSSAAAVRSHL
jgi:phosphotransferase system enzyme I (PtsI)